MPVEPPALDAASVFAILDAHGVRYVVVGGYAAHLHGSSRVTTDIDVTPEQSTENLERLVAALHQLGGGIRVDSLHQGLPFRTSVATLLGMKTLNLRTPHGDVDITFVPDGTGGYPDLVRAAQSYEVGHVRVLVADLVDVIRSKTAAGRPKDLASLPELREIAARRPAPEPRQRQDE